MAFSCFKTLKKASLQFLPKGAIDNIIFYGSTPGETKNKVVFWHLTMIISNEK